MAETLFRIPLCQFFIISLLFISFVSSLSLSLCLSQDRICTRYMAYDTYHIKKRKKVGRFLFFLDWGSKQSKHWDLVIWSNIHFLVAFVYYIGRGFFLI